MCGCSQCARIDCACSSSQAVNKLDEALQVSGLGQAGRMTAAIDLGAAPGAWSMYLASTSECARGMQQGRGGPGGRVQEGGGALREECM